MADQWLTIERAVHRDENGNLLAEIIDVEGMTNEDGTHPKIKFVPIPKGKYTRLAAEGTTDRPTDEAIILEHVLQPKFTPENVKEMDQKTLNDILFAVMSGSTGMPQSMIREKTLKAVVEGTDEWLKKKLNSNSGA